ncbi:type III-A CRISPR-associated RAMP protein Csm4 [bacterium]|nr:type III-A CRISPR-associated RAMP protein Csm4 [bacterium]
MKEYLVKLKPISPFHIGEPGIGLEATQSYVPADLLFSAFCNAYGALFGKDQLESLLNSFLSSPPFLISSAFPFNKDILFFPPPLTTPRIQEKFRKELKKRKFIPLQTFTQWIKGEEISYPFEKFEPEVEVLPSVVLDRLNMSSQIYHRSALFFPEGSGLFFLLRLHAEEMLEKFKGALQLLGDMGIGGERSLGYGYFKVEIEEKSLFPPPDSSAILTLSPVVPAPSEEIDLANCRYNLSLRGGWTSSIFERRQGRRKRIWMLSEGSVFYKPIRGQLVDLTPNGFSHKVYRYAFAFPVGVIMR